MFNEFSPLKKKIFRLMDNEGKLKKSKWTPELSDKDLIKAYKDMLFARTADLQIVSYQRQGRIYTYPPNLGQEGIHGAVGKVIRKEDWLVPAFREMGVYLAKGMSLLEIFLYYMGNEDGSKMKNANKVLPIAVPIASQLLHASGIGYEINYNNKKEVVYTFVGDGGTSEGDFHEALNFAGVWKAPVVFIVQNNQYGISTPFRMQTASDGIAIKSEAYGIKGIQVDGNDYFAMLAATQAAQKAALKGEGPVLIEAVTYRKGAHTTSDDPTKYRTKEEEESWLKTDPIDRMRKHLISKKLWSDEEEEKLIKEYKKEVDRQFEEAENYPEYPINEVFDNLYEDKPQDLIDQQREYEKFLKWKANLK